MIRSMTGFGRGAEKSPYGKITAEIKSLNHKNLSITCNPFNGYFLLEEKIKKICEGKIYRGKVFVRISRESAGKQKSLHRVEVNEDAARGYLRKIKKLQKDLGIKGDISINEIVSLPGVVESGAEKRGEALWPHVKSALEKAIDKLLKYRASEGAMLARDFRTRLSAVKKQTSSITKYQKQCVNGYRKKLLKAMKSLAKEFSPDTNKLEEEVAAFAKNCDITEEIIRLDSHIKAYGDAMKKAKKDVGKKLDFIAQEMQREANTIGAKSGDFRISRAVIEIKSEIEKMREQIKNIE